jgi:hypothetical protein
LRQFPPLNARRVITLACGLVNMLPHDLFEQLIRHTLDIETVHYLLQNEAG